MLQMVNAVEVDTLKLINDTLTNISIDNIDTTITKKLYPASFFSSDIKEKLNVIPNQNNDEGNNWKFFTFLFILVIFIYIKTGYSKSFDKLKKALTNINLAKQTIRDQNLLIRRTSLLLSVIFYSVTGLIAYEVSVYYNIELNIKGFMRFLLFSSLIFSIYSIKYLILKAFGSVFRLAVPIGYYTFYIYLINNFLGILLIPFSIIISFSSEIFAVYIIYLVMFILIISILYRYFKGIELNNFYFRYYKFHFFLYLCTFEIIPWMFLFKSYNNFIVFF